MWNAESKTVGICYFGTKGGAPRQLLNLVKTSVKNGYKPLLFLSDKNELLEEFSQFQLQITSYEIPSGLNLALFNYRKRNDFKKRFISDVSKNTIDRLYFLMPHPWDFLTYKRLSKLNIEIWRAVHDLKPHSGDIWPNRFTVLRMIKNADVLVTFSRYVATNLKTDKLVLIDRIIESGQSSRSAEKNPHLILVIGRMKKYKNLQILEEVMGLLPTNYRLVVAGLGSRKLLNTPRVENVDRWLSNTEIESLIDKAGIVLLPYKEASQSGVIPLATSRSTPVVITAAGGLQEQIVPGVTGILAVDASAKSISRAILDADKVTWPDMMHQRDNVSFLKRLFS